MPSHYLNQCWIIVNWAPGNKLQWNLNKNSNIFIKENAFEIVLCETATILSQPQCVNVSHWLPTYYNRGNRSTIFSKNSCGKLNTLKHVCLPSSKLSGHLLSEKENSRARHNQAVMTGNHIVVKQIENNACTRVTNCFSTHRRVILCLFPELLSNKGNKYKNNTRVSAETVRHESAYIILFLIWHNESINDDKKDDPYTSSPCLCPADNVTIDCRWRHNNETIVMRSFE